MGKNDRKEEARLLLQDLVAIPSHGAETPNREVSVVEYIVSWLEENCPQYNIAQYPTLTVPHIICSMASAPKIALACHADTMPPSRPEHTMATGSGDEISGLGTKDMKGGIVASLLALKYAPNPENVALVIYGDEEYSQRGIAELSAAVADGTVKLSPEIIISPESRFNLVHSARGIVVCDITVRGRRAHSSRPHQGVDAVKLFYAVFAQFEKEIGVTTKLGKTTTTIAHIEGGVFGDDGEIITQAGMVPDIVRATLAIRNSDFVRRGDDFLVTLRALVEAQGLAIETANIVVDHPTRQTDDSIVAQLCAKARDCAGVDIQCGDPALAGYNDAAILGDVVGAPVVNFGPYGEGNHMAHEWVSLDSILKTVDVFISWIDEKC